MCIGCTFFFKLRHKISILYITLTLRDFTSCTQGQITFSNRPATLNHMHLNKSQFKEYVYKSSPPQILHHNKSHFYIQCAKPYTQSYYYVQSVVQGKGRKRDTQRKLKVLSLCPAVTSSRPQMKTNTSCCSDRDICGLYAGGAKTL